MIAKAKDRGSRTRGLIEYLFGPGRADEHANPRVVAGWDPGFIRTAGEATLTAFERGLLAEAMDAPMRLHSIPPGGHVYHVPISLHADDGELSDEQWAQVGQEAADALGLSAAGAAWVLVRHGKSAGGQDHAHFVSVPVGVDGRRVDLWNDWETWEKVRHAAEDRWGLTRTRRRGGGVPDHTRGEIERAAREGRGEPDRVDLARRVRAAAVAARDEADWLRRMRRDGIVVRPRWAPGGQREVVGYSVGLRPAPGGKPLWFGGAKLAPDLGLSEIRGRWPAPDDAQAADALRTWRPRGWRELPTGRQVRTQQLRAQAWEEAARRVAAVREAVAGLDPHDHLAWASVSRETAGVLGALARRVDGVHRGEITRAADALGRVAQTEHRTLRHQRRPETADLAGVARVAFDAVLLAQGGNAAVTVLVMQLVRLIEAIEQAHTAGGRVPHVQRSQTAVRELRTWAGQDTSVGSGHPVIGRVGRPVVADRGEAPMVHHNVRGRDVRER